MKTPQIAALPGMSPLGLPITETARHTPGPWRAEFEGSRGYRMQHADNVGLPFGYFSGLDTHAPVNKANARLIACAPDMLAELIAKEAWIVDYIPEGTTGRAAELASVRAAIAKAEGR